MLLNLDCYIHLSLWCDDYKVNIDYDVNFGMCWSFVCVDLCSCHSNLLNMMFL
jgi:hypothetical protein